MIKRLSSFFTLLTLTHLSWVSSIDTVNARVSCQTTVDAIAREIRNKGTTVSVEVTFEISENRLGNTRKFGTVSFALNTNENSGRVDSVATNIINSPVLMKSYATRIFASCGGTGFVNFWVFCSACGGEGVDFGMTDDGTLTYYDCRDFPGQLTNKISPEESYLGYYCAFVIPNF